MTIFKTNTDSNQVGFSCVLVRMTIRKHAYE